MIKDDIYEKLNDQLAGISRAEIRAANLEVYPRLIDALEKRSAECKECKALYEESEKYTNDIVSVLKGDAGFRKQFEEFVNRAFMHLHDEHQTLPKGKLLSVSVLVGMLVGLSVAVIAAYFLNIDLMRFGALGWLIGVMAGWITGKVREKNLQKQNKLF